MHLYSMIFKPQTYTQRAVPLHVVDAVLLFQYNTNKHGFIGSRLVTCLVIKNVHIRKLWFSQYMINYCIMHASHVILFFAIGV